MVDLIFYIVVMLLGIYAFFTVISGAGKIGNLLLNILVKCSGIFVMIVSGVELAKYMNLI